MNELIGFLSETKASDAIAICALLLAVLGYMKSREALLISEGNSKTEQRLRAEEEKRNLLGNLVVEISTYNNYSSRIKIIEMQLNLVSGELRSELKKHYPELEQLHDNILEAIKLLKEQYDEIKTWEANAVEFVREQAYYEEKITSLDDVKLHADSLITLFEKVLGKARSIEILANE